MTVRKKISLLITAAGFFASLIFSCIILWQMIEQPFRIIDADMEAIAQRAVTIVSNNGKIDWNNAESKGKDSLSIGDDLYWLKIYDQNSGHPIYLSRLATLIKIPELRPGSSINVSVIIPRKQIPLGQDNRNEVTFRVRGLEISHNGRIFLVRVGLPMEKLEEEIWEIVIGIASGLVFSVMLLMAISYFIAGLILEPVRRINDQALDITEKHLDRRIPVSGDQDEFNALAQTLNQVFSRLQHSFMQQKRFLADASHELKTPLTMMRLSLDEIRAPRGEDSSIIHNESLMRLTEQVLRMDRLVKDLLDLSSLEIEGTAMENPVEVVQVLESLITDYQFLAGMRKIQIIVRLPTHFTVNGSVEKLNRAFSNILDNAVKYNVDGGQIEVVGYNSSVELTIAVTNTGPGVAENEIDKVFEQFYRVEQSRSLQHGGSGLGLAIVKRIVELHGGWTKFESKQGDWTRVTVCLPLSR